jgi:hypothetical protein
MLERELVCLAVDSADPGSNREMARCKDRGATLEKQRRRLGDLIEVVELEEKRDVACETAKAEAEVEAHREANVGEQDIVSMQVGLPTQARSS